MDPDDNDTVIVFPPGARSPHPLNVLRHYVSGAIARGEATAIVEIPANDNRPESFRDIGHRRSSKAWLREETK